MNTVGLFAYGETALFALRALLRECSISWIIVSPAGKISESGVESLAKKNNIRIVRTNNNDEIYELVNIDIPNCVVISSYNKILDERILNLTKFINVHHGDLPRFRGRANINWAIINGRKNIGLTFHQTVPNLDAGNIYDQYIVPILKDDTVKNVYDKFNSLIENKLCGVVRKVIGGFVGIEQKGVATYCCTRTPNDGLIDWTKSSIEIYNLVRALTHPYPGAFTFFEGKRMIIWDCTISEKGKAYEGRIAGRVIALHKNKGVEVLTGDSSIIVKSVSYDGEDTIASDIIKTVRVSLGIDFIYLYENLNKLLKNQ